jgi:hypothetical protein
MKRLLVMTAAALVALFAVCLPAAHAADRCVEVKQFGMRAATIALAEASVVSGEIVNHCNRAMHIDLEAVFRNKRGGEVVDVIPIVIGEDVEPGESLPFSMTFPPQPPVIESKLKTRPVDGEGRR